MQFELFVNISKKDFFSGTPVGSHIPHVVVSLDLSSEDPGSIDPVCSRTPSPVIGDLGGNCGQSTVLTITCLPLLYVNVEKSISYLLKVSILQGKLLFPPPVKLTITTLYI